MRNVYLAFAKEKSIREESASGGVFPIIARNIIQNSGVVYGAAFNEKMQVVHERAENIDDLAKFKGSKYVQSRMGEIFSRVQSDLDEHRYVLFSGTPCEIAGLHRFIQRNNNYLVTLEVICHGVPSPSVWNSYISSFNKNVSKINFCDKTKGWKNREIKIEFDDGSIYQSPQLMNSYMKGFVENLYLRPSCFECRFKNFSAEADFTIGDFWGYEKTQWAIEVSDKNGISAMIVHTSKAEDILSKISDELVMLPSNIEDIKSGNQYLVRSVKMNDQRSRFYKLIRKGKSVEKSVNTITSNSVIRRINNKMRVIYEKFFGGGYKL